MSTTLLVVQTLNGLQLGVLLFLIAAGLTLVFGVMDFINLAHGVQYMLGAYLAVAFYAVTGSFLAALVLALAGTLAFGLVLEFLVFRHLYGRDHLDQVMATFGIILFLNQGVKLVWGAAPLQPADAGVVVRLGRGLPTGCSIRCGGSSSSRRASPSPRCSMCSSPIPGSACWCAPARPTPPWCRRSGSTSAACS